MVFVNELKINKKDETPVKSESKKLAPSNFAPLKLACLKIDWIKRGEGERKVRTKNFLNRF